MKNLRIGIQLYSLRHFLKTPDQVPGVFEKVKAMGAEVVQVSGMCPMDPDELAKISRDNELPVCITHVPFDRIRNDLKALAEEHLVYGCKNMGIGSMPVRFRKSADGVRRFIDFMNTAAEGLKEFDMTFAYHNHAFEFRRFDGRSIMDMLIEDSTPEVNFIPDTCWLEAGGVRSEDYLAKMSGRFDTVHLKDYRRSFLRPPYRAIGKGILDFASIMTASEKHGAQNAVIELDSSRRMMKDMAEGMERLLAIRSKG